MGRRICIRKRREGLAPHRFRPLSYRAPVRTILTAKPSRTGTSGRATPSAGWLAQAGSCDILPAVRRHGFRVLYLEFRTATLELSPVTLSKMSTEMNGIRIGTAVPDFTMETYEPAHSDFGKVALADLKKAGRWTVLVFYPADFTFVCPTELADLAEKHAAMEALGCTIISVSTDTKFAHLAWRNTEGLLRDVKYTMASDTTGEVSRIFGVYDPSSGLALRGTFIINPLGILVSSEINFYNVGRDAAELLRKVEANVHLMAHPTEACPAKWRPGGKTLTPSKDMVGKVAEAMAH